MSQDVYICFDAKDQDLADNVCDYLEKNKLSCWIKSRDVGAKNIFDEIIHAISTSYSMVLIYSKHSNVSNFVKTEVDYALKNKIPILVYKIDDSEIDEGLGYFVRNRPTIDASADPEGEFDTLVSQTSKIVKQQRSFSKKLSFIYKEHKKPVIAAAVIVLVAIVAIFAYSMIGQDSGDSSYVPLNTSDVKINITDFHVDDVRKKGYSWNYSYFVGGTISPEPSGSYIISTDFYDVTGSLVNTTETKIADAQKINDGFLLGSEVSGSKDIKKVEVQLIDGDGYVIAHQEAKL